MAQIRVSFATPQAVATGSFSMDFDPATFGDIADVQMFSAAGDVIGVAEINGRHVDVRFSSPSAGVGRLPDLPVATVAIPILAGATVGATANITVAAGPTPWKDFYGTFYALAVESGTITVGGDLTIQNVMPGGGLLPPGSIVRVAGSGFGPDTAIEVPGVSVAAARYISANEFDITLAGPAELTGKHVRARNKDGVSADFVSALRGIPLDTSAKRLLPLFPLRAHTSIDAGAAVRSLLGRRGVALENQNSTPVDVQVEKRFWGLDGRKTLTLAPGAIFVSQDLQALEVQYPLSAGLLPSQPIRAVLLSNPGPGPAGPVNANEVVTGYTKFQLPEIPLSVGPETLSFRYQAGGQVPDPQNINGTPKVYSIDTFGFTASAATNNGGRWLTVTPAQGSADKGFTLTTQVDPIRLMPGIYTGTVTITPSLNDSKPMNIPVMLTVTEQPDIKVSFDYQGSFQVDPGAPSQLSSFGVTSNGTPAALAISAKTDNGSNWLSVASATATTPATINFSVDPAGLTVGTYHGTITIKGPLNTETRGVTLYILAPPVLSLDPISATSATFSLQAGPTYCPPVSIYTNSSAITVAATTDSGEDWLIASVPSSAGGRGFFTIKADASALAPGIYTGVVTVTSPGVANALRVPVKLTVWSGETPPLTVAPSALTLTGNIDNQPVQAFEVSSGGLPLEVQVKPEIPPNSCILSASFQRTSSTPQPLTPTTVTVGCSGSPGDYRGTITVTAGSQSVVVPVSIHIAPGAYHGLTTPPVIGSIVNAASNTTGALAPGEIITIHGSGVGTRTPMAMSFDPSGAVARNLNGLRVLFDGVPAPLVYTSLFQTNVIVPYEVARQKTTFIQVESAGSRSEPIAVPIAAAAPALFTINSSGVGRASVLNQDNSINDPTNPAARGSVIQIYATGEGQTTPAGITGSVVHKDTKRPELLAGATIGGAEAQVTYAGSAPESVAGLFQVNVVVPQSAATGPAVPLILNIGGSQSQAGVTIAIQ